jgi:hypothetical protein
MVFSSDLEEDYDGSDRTYISDSEDYQYVRLNLNKKGSVLTEDVLQELTRHVKMMSFFLGWKQQQQR